MAMINGDEDRNGRDSISNKSIRRTTCNREGVVCWRLCIGDSSLIEVHDVWVEEDDTHQQNLKDACRKYSNGTNSYVEYR